MKKVLVVGSAILDILVKSNDFRVMKSHQVSGGVALCEVYGGKTEADEIFLEIGGGGTTVAVGLTRLGLVGAVISRTGDDWVRERILSNLSLEGVETGMLQTELGGKTGVSVILVAVDGGRSIITYRGSSQRIDGKEIDWESVGRADWLQISSLGGDMALLEDLVAYAHKNKVKIGFNPGKLELLKHDDVLKIFPKIELLLVNRMEAAALLKTKYDEVNQLAQMILRLGVKNVAVTDGTRGALIANRNYVVTGPAFKTKSVDDTGAGDAFTCGVVAGMVNGDSLATALKMGLSNGASQVTKLGAKNGLLNKKEMTSWLRKKLVIVEEKS